MEKEQVAQCYSSEFKGIASIVLENEFIRAEWLPSYGAKLASLKIKRLNNKETLYQSSNNKLIKPKYNSCFSQYDTSGFDECFPSIDACKITVIKEGKETTVDVPDHGEVWALSWNCKVKGNNQVEFSVDSPFLGYRLKKSVTILGCKLKFKYHLELVSDIDSLPFLWTPHALFNYDEHTELIVPTHLNKIKSVCGYFRMPRTDLIYDYPKIKEYKVEGWECNRFYASDENTCEKFYFIEKLRREDEFGFRNNDYKILMTVDERIAPYLGVWKNQGAHNNTHNFALEPCSGVYDSAENAQKNNTVSYVLKDQPQEWFFYLHIL